VALKVLRPEMAGPVVRVRFLREAQMAASLNDDHVVTIYQVAESGGRPYLVMELLRGESLEQRLRRERWLPVPEALDYARQIARGLKAAHSVGLVHRDIKPANIWLESRADGQAPIRAKILDFGLAKLIRDNSGLTQEGVSVGTPAYMAPEQLEARPVDARADIYALGVVLYRMIAGAAPFEGPSVPRLMAAILEQEPPRVSSIRLQVPAPVEQLLNELLSKDPDRRPPDADSLLDRLRSIEVHLSLVGQGVSTPAPCEPAAPGRRRIGLGVWAGVAAIAASVAVGLGVLWSQLIQPPGPANSPSEVPSTPVADSRQGTDTGGPSRAINPAPLPSGVPIKVGLLHSRTGPLSEIERPMIEAESLAIEEINASGGLLGRPVQKVIADGRSEEEVFAERASQLIDRDRVAVLVGCLSSASRKRVKEVCEQRGVLLFYPMNFEGAEESSHVIYVGGGPNQQLLPVVRWAIGFSDPPRRRFFLVGSESIYSRACQEAFKGELARHGLQPVGVRSLPIGQTTGYRDLIREMRAKNTDIVLDTLDIEADRLFFRAMGGLNITAADLPIVSLCLGEDQLRTVDPKLLEGHYSALNYFEEILSPENARFLERMRHDHAVSSLTASMEAAYVSVMIWRRAVEKAGSLETDKVRAAVAGLELIAPEGRVIIDPITFYGSRIARIARMEDHGQFEIVYSSPGPMKTTIYPPPYDRAGWEAFTNGLWKSWGGRWTGAYADH
jgi:urea transport system substrate-binding protein